MSDRRNDIQIGLFSIIGVLLLAMMILIFGGFKDFLADTYLVTAYFPNAAGTAEGTPVRLRGIEIGQVRTIALAAEYGVMMKLDIRQTVKVQKDAPLAIKQEGFIANIYLEFGVGKSEEFLPRDDTAVVEGEVMTFAAYVEKASTTLVEMGSKVGGKIEKVTDELAALAANLNDIASDGTFRSDLKGITSNANAITADLRVKLPDMMTDLAAAAKDARASIEKSKGLVATWQSLGDELRATNTDVRAQVANLGNVQASLTETSESIARLATTLNEIAQAVQRGEGSAGKLMTDDELYRTLVEAIDMLAAAATEFKDLAETIKEHPDWVIKGPPRDRR
jgi:phospholipid/cholesterol/gamma-HCH transport system substrate-binding protein